MMTRTVISASQILRVIGSRFGEPSPIDGGTGPRLPTGHFPTFLNQSISLAK
jgi:hypothetical protein